jgi:hypothetical protein
MNQRITRRRFGQLAIASTTVAGITYLANKTFAQTPNLVIVGASLGSPTSSDDTTSTVLDSTDPTGSENTTAANTAIELLLPTLNIATLQVQTPSPVQGVNILPSEELTGFTSLNGTLVLAVTPASTSSKGGDSTRLIFLSTPPRTVTVSGLKKEEKLTSLAVTNDGKLSGLVVRKRGRPPVNLVEINDQTGAITSSNKINLPQTDRFEGLAQCPDGKLYTTTVDRRGETSLVQLDLGQKKPVVIAPLKVDGTVWNNGLQSLVCSSANQLFAFGGLRYDTPLKLYTVNSSNGEMSLLSEFNAAQITILQA